MHHGRAGPPRARRRGWGVKRLEKFMEAFMPVLAELAVPLLLFILALSIAVSLWERM